MNVEKSVSRRISPVWLVPLVALVAAIWSGYKAISDDGPEIYISFKDAAGIAVGKTTIRYKDVEVGKVVDLKLSEDLKTVYVTAEMNKDIKPHLSENSRFWVARPQISIFQVSGLSTLFSGAHIGMDTGDKGEFTNQFVGLEKPPTIYSDTPGKHFLLRSKNLGSMYPGTSVFFREIKVGQVTSLEIDDEDGWIEVNIFIPEPYDRWVTERSRFWNISGFKIDVGHDGITAETGPLATLLLGGIAFDVGPVPSQPAEEKSYFFLYPDYDAVLEGDFSLNFPYTLHFQGSVRGLKVGASVEFKGIKVGEVTQIELNQPSEEVPYGVDVQVQIEPQRFSPTKLIKRDLMNQEISKHIERGLRAQLKTSSLVLDTLFIDLIFEPSREGFTLTDTAIPSIPTVGKSGQISEITQQISQIAKKLDQIPLEGIGNDLKASLGSLRKILHDFDQNDTSNDLDQLLTTLNHTGEKLNNSLDSTDKLIRSADAVIGPDTQLHYELIRMLQEVRDSARAIESLSTSLNQKPESIIFGKDN